MQQTDWKGLSADEKDGFVNSLVEYGTDFVAPLYSVVEKIEEALQQKNSTIRAQADARPIGKVLSEEEMGVGYDRRTGPVLWFGTPKPGFIYTHPEASAPGLSEDELRQQIDALWRAYQLGQISADHTAKDVFAEVVTPLLTRAGAATVAEPSATEREINEIWTTLAERQASQQQAEPGADERVAFDPTIDDLAFIRAWPEIQKAGYSYGWMGIGLAAWRAAQSGQRAGVAELQTSLGEMVNRFLCWRLPADFQPDAGIHFKPVNHPNAWPTGTNLFTADQAEAMLAHALGVEKIAAATTQQQEGE